MQLSETPSPRKPTLPTGFREPVRKSRAWPFPAPPLPPAAPGNLMANAGKVLAVSAGAYLGERELQAFSASLWSLLTAAGGGAAVVASEPAPPF